MDKPINAESFRDLVTNARIRAFAQNTITKGYLEEVPAAEQAIRELVNCIFDRLLAHAHSEESFARALAGVNTEILHQQNRNFWFNALYADYRQRLKPQRRIQRMDGWLTGKRILDFGCGDGMTSLVLAQHGYDPTLADVMDYRNPAARAFDFVRMENPRMIPYADKKFDSAILFSVLHHIAPENLNAVLAELRRVSHHIFLEEDCYGVSEHVNGFAQVLNGDEHFCRFHSLAQDDQLRYLMFIDFWGNVITQGLDEINLPFEFKTPEEWIALFQQQGFTVRRVLVRGFQRGNWSKSCHVWFSLDSMPC